MLQGRCPYFGAKAHPVHPSARMFFGRSASEDLTFFCKSLFFLQKCGYNISVDGWFDGSWMIFSKHFSKLCQCIYPREGTATYQPKDSH